MAYRPIFIFEDNSCFQQEYECTWHRGYAFCQKQLSIESLHNNFKAHNPDLKILEISPASENPLGVLLNTLKLKNNKGHTVEGVFQGSKVFEQGGPYDDLYRAQGIVAKKDIRIDRSGKLKAFRLYGRRVELAPDTLCFNWIYCSALHQNKDLVEQLIEYDAFTDIDFNPLKATVCQAHAASIYVALYKTGLLESAMKSIADFELTIYGTVGGKVPTN